MLDLFGLAQPVLPGPFQRPCHQTVLRLHDVILPPCPFRLVAGALAPEVPLPFQQPRFRLDLADGRRSQRDLVRRQGGQQHALDFRVHLQGTHLLAARAAGARLVRAAEVDPF